MVALKDLLNDIVIQQAIKRLANGERPSQFVFRTFTVTAVDARFHRTQYIPGRSPSFTRSSSAHPGHPVCEVALGVKSDNKNSLVEGLYFEGFSSVGKGDLVDAMIPLNEADRKLRQYEIVVALKIIAPDGTLRRREQASLYQDYMDDYRH